MVIKILKGLLLGHGIRRMGMAFLAISIAAVLFTLFASFTLVIDQQTEKLLAAYGGNLIVTGKTETIPLSIAGVPLGKLQEENALPANLVQQIKTLDQKHQIQWLTPVLKKPNALSTLELRMTGSPAEREALATRIAGLSSSLHVETPLERVQAESQLLRKTHFLMLAIAAFVTLTAMLCIGTTLTAIMLERQKEIGLMKALGATSKTVSRLFLYETSLLGIGGGLLGWLTGAGLAHWVGQAIFSTRIPTHPSLLLGVVLLSWLVTTLASLLPIRTALLIDPIRTLKGN